jgi:hypothetical protein
MKIKGSLYIWRCKCAHENDSRYMTCSSCGKRRWKQLGVNEHDAAVLLESIIPHGVIAHR